VVTSGGGFLAQVEAICASRGFARSENMKRLLRFLAAEAMAGRSSALTATAIARSALGRGPNFDPRIDPVVRVEAARLRRLLADYAANEGREDPFVVSLPAGAYLLVRQPRELGAVTGSVGVEPAQPEARIEPDASPLARQRGRFLGLVRRWAVQLGLVLAVFAGAGMALVWKAAQQPSIVRLPGEAGQTVNIVSGIASLTRPAVAGGMPVVHVDRFVSAADDPYAVTLAATAEARVRDALARFDGIEVLAASPPRLSENPMSPSGGVRDAPPWPEAFKPTYMVTATFMRNPEGRHLVIGRLIDVRRGVIVSSRTFTEPYHAAPEDSANWLNDFVREVASSIAAPYGLIAANEWREKRAVDPFTDREACVLLTFGQWRIGDFGEGAHCLDALAAKMPGDSLVLAMLAYSKVMAARERKLFGGRVTSIDLALAAARAAVSAAPNSSRARAALFGVLKVLPDKAEALRNGMQALRLNPYDTDLMADVGAFKISQGEFILGAEMIDHANRLNPTPPDWVWGYRALAALQAGNVDAMRDIARNATSIGYVINALMNVISAADIEQPRFKASRDEILKRFPEFDSDRRQALRAMSLADPVIEDVLAALRKNRGAPRN
jgi:TolB-like protein